jgi:acyl-CoA synthetase (AMP-forming)/AMP-acid ligase II
LRRPRHQPETRHHDHRAGPFAGSATDPALEELAQARLARYKQPRAFVHLDALPRSPNGKLDRRALAGLVRKALA